MPPATARSPEILELRIIPSIHRSLLIDITARKTCAVSARAQGIVQESVERHAVATDHRIKLAIISGRELIGSSTPATTEKIFAAGHARGWENCLHYHAGFLLISQQPTEIPKHPDQIPPILVASEPLNVGHSRVIPSLGWDKATPGHTKEYAFWLETRIAHPHTKHDPKVRWAFVIPN